jgi:microcin C transport system substrate-binding protein
MILARLKSRLVVLLAASTLIAPLTASAQDAAVWRTGVATVGELKHPNGFDHFDYVNPQAPKGGALRLSVSGTFDTLNPLLAKGEVASGLSLVFDTLMKSADDEITSSYGLLAEGVSYPDDISNATFRLRKEAMWADGQPITPADVVFSFEKAKELNPQLSVYYNHVTKAEATGERDITFTFDEKNNRELPLILGQLLIVPKHWWEGAGADGKPRDITRGTLEPVMGSGPYKVAAVSPGSTIRYELRDDYWGKDLNVNVGHNNFGTMTYTYFTDRDVEFQAFKSNNIDYWQENQASRWATGYDFPAVTDGRVKKEEISNPYRSVGIMQALVPNARKDKFKDPKVRLALNYAFDFEEMNKTLFYSQYQRINSFFMGTELASTGLPTGKELEILQEVKDQIPPEVFTTEYRNPVGGDPAKFRDNMREAVKLLGEAGYEIRNSRMVNKTSGQSLDIEILVDNAAMERVVLPFTQNLKRIGINATVRTVDASQYTNRTRAFDYDMIVNLWAESLNPGNEQADYWGSASVERSGSKNYAGISSPGIDALIRKVIFAPNRDDLVAATRALDRVLLAGNYVIPQFYRGEATIAYWDKFNRPENLPTYAIGFPDIWWSKDAAK